MRRAILDYETLKQQWLLIFLLAKVAQPSGSSFCCTMRGGASLVQLSIARNWVERVRIPNLDALNKLQAASSDLIFFGLTHFQDSFHSLQDRLKLLCL